MNRFKRLGVAYIWNSKKASYLASGIWEDIYKRVLQYAPGHEKSETTF